MRKKLSILIVDDHDTIVSGLKYELQERFHGVEIAVANSIYKAKLLIQDKAFHIAIIDVSFKNETNSDGIDLVHLMKKRYPSTKLISYTSYADKIHYIDQLQSKKVDAIVSKLDGNVALKKAVVALLQDSAPFYSAEVITALKKAKEKKTIHISKREREVVLLLRKSLTFSEIAKELSISKNTVDFHAKNLYSKFSVHKSSELLAKIGPYL